MVCHAQGISPADDGDKQMSKILPTENQDWGFWGTMREHAQQAWLYSDNQDAMSATIRMRLRGWILG
jgi:hypothetical protein